MRPTSRLSTTSTVQLSGLPNYDIRVLLDLQLCPVARAIQ